MTRNKGVLLRHTAVVSFVACALATAPAWAAGFNWKKYAGTEITWAYDVHPYADAVVAHLKDFEKLTGIKVKPELYPDDTYWGKLNVELSTKSPEWDVVGIGIEPAWDVTPGGELQPLNKYLDDPTMTAPGYDYTDFFPSLRKALTWDVGNDKIIPNPNGKIWAIPHAFENIQLMYRKDILARLHVTVPKTLPELVDDCKKIKAEDPSITPMAVRGVRFWSSIHTAPISIATTYGVKDFVTKDGKVDTGLDSPQSIKFHEAYVNMIKTCAPKSWPNDNWYQVVSGLSSGKTAMAIDSNMFGFWNDMKGASAASGKIAFAPPPTAPGASSFASNIWIWSLAMNNASKKKGAAWYFIQWATSKQMDEAGAVAGKLVNPPRESTWKSKAWIDFASQPEFNNFVTTFNEVQPKAKLLFTPRFGFATAINAWAVAMQDMVGGADIKTRLKQLASDIRGEMN